MRWRVIFACIYIREVARPIDRQFSFLLVWQLILTYLVTGRYDKTTTVALFRVHLVWGASPSSSSPSSSPVTKTFSPFKKSLSSSPVTHFAFISQLHHLLQQRVLVMHLLLSLSSASPTNAPFHLLSYQLRDDTCLIFPNSTLLFPMFGKECICCAWYVCPEHLYDIYIRLSGLCSDNTPKHARSLHDFTDITITVSLIIIIISNI